MKKKSIKEPAYTASFKTFGKTYSSTGASVQEALEGLKPDITRAHGILSMEHAERRSERILSGVVVRRLFGKGSRITREIALKNACNLFQGM